MSSMTMLGGAAAAAVLGGGIGYMLAKRKPSAAAPGGVITLGYWKIRGLCAPLRMMCHYAGQSFVNKAYGEDAKTAWFGGDKPALAAKNALINLPYVVDGETVVTQSNSCLLYLGEKLGIDAPECAVHNHQALDQIMDLRNDTMKIVYPFSGMCKSKDDFPAALEKHMESKAAGHLKKLEGHCKGPYMCGGALQSCDFHMFEMFDQHVAMCEQSAVKFDFTAFPKLWRQHAAMRADPKLAEYFASEPYAKYAFNNAMYTTFAGAGYGDGPFGPTTESKVVLSSL